ncbi:hypothetical protein IFM89_014378 [Coptis chinensis]|uniref:Uncharacterized protein n=1 Tax=Coptis chinensis TaxID=261450 RepID=A0A835GZB0_9MAGN|nr:hypothetical protein IFM89_014378 [Coptis chinensis]
MAMNRVLVLCLAAFFVCSLLFEATTAVRYIPYPVLTPNRRLLSEQVDPEDKEQELQGVVSVAPSLSEMLEDGQQYYQGDVVVLGHD